MDMKKQWKKMVEKNGKQEIHFMSYDARMNKKEETQLRKQIEESEKQFVYEKCIETNLNIYLNNDKFVEHPIK